MVIVKLGTSFEVAARAEHDRGAKANGPTLPDESALIISL